MNKRHTEIIKYGLIAIAIIVVGYFVSISNDRGLSERTAINKIKSVEELGNGPSGWSSYLSSDKSFVAYFPEEVVVEKDGDFITYGSSGKNIGEAYAVEVIHVPEDIVRILEKDKESKNTLYENRLTRLLETLPKEENFRVIDKMFKTVNGFYSLLFEVQGVNAYISSSVFLFENTLYQVVVAAPSRQQAFDNYNLFISNFSALK